MIQLTNGVSVSEDRLIQKVTASVDSLTSTGKLEVMQYDDKMPVAAVTLTRKGARWTPPTGAALRVRMGKPDGFGVLNDALGMDDEGTVYFAFTRQMTAANGTGELSIEIGADDGVKSSAVMPVTVKKKPVQDDMIQSGDEYLALEALLQQVRQAAQSINDNAEALQTLQENAGALQTFQQNAAALQTLQDNAAAIQNVSANLGVIQEAPAAAETIRQYAAELQALEENADALHQAAQNMEVIQSAPAAARSAEEAAQSAAQSAETAGQNAETARQEATRAGASADAAAQSQTGAQASASAAAQAAAKAESVGQEIESNLDVIKTAPESALQAAQSAQEAKLAAQQALGFRTFFSAVGPNEGGSLDPSRPVTTPTAQESWTLESKGDRIESVQVHGFTQTAETGDSGPENVGYRLRKCVFTGQQDEGWAIPEGKSYFSCGVSGQECVDPEFFPSYGTAVEYLVLENNTGYGIAWAYGPRVSLPGLSPRDGTTLEKFKQYLAAHPLTIWYLPPEESESTGLYIPLQTHGAEYRCQCLELSAPLCAGDFVQSKVSSGCDAVVTLDGSADENWSLSAQNKEGVLRAFLPVPGSVSGTQIANWLRKGAVLDWDKLKVDSFVSISQSGNINISLVTDKKTVSELREILSAKPLKVWYRTADYTAEQDLPVQLETHNAGVSESDGALPILYAHDAAELLAIPKDDGTYTLNAQAGTQVSVTFKAFQDGGDAAKLQGHTWEELLAYVDSKVSQMASAPLN